MPSFDAGHQRVSARPNAVGAKRVTSAARNRRTIAMEPPIPPPAPYLDRPLRPFAPSLLRHCDGCEAL